MFQSEKWQGLFSVAMVASLAMGLAACPPAPSTCRPPSVMYMGRCLPPCVENGIDYCAGPDGSVVDPRDASLDAPSDAMVDVVLREADAGDVAMLDEDRSCPGANEQRCVDVCVDLMTSVEHCQRCGNRCPVVANGVPVCGSAGCIARCNMGFHNVGGTCVADGTVPRLIAPLSLGDVTLTRPTLRWELPAAYSGAVVELCRDRACTMVIETLNAMGSSVRPTMALPPGSVVFWRVRGMVGMEADSTTSATWLFHVPAADASSGVDTSFHAHTDFNGDGFDDLAVGSIGASRNGGMARGLVNVYLGSMAGIVAMPMRTFVGAPEDRLGTSVAGAGDLNGDGFADLVVGSPFADPMARADAGEARVFLGNEFGLADTASVVLQGTSAGEWFGASAAGAGDVNADGYADLIVGAPHADPPGALGAGRVSVYLGSATAVMPMPQRTIVGAAGDALGTALSSAGDVNGDSFGDVIIGAPGSDPLGISNAGAALLFHGTAGGLEVVPERIGGVAANEAFGENVAGGGDLNGDGFGDLAIAVPGASDGPIQNVGGARLFTGRVGSMVPGQALLGEYADWPRLWSLSIAGSLDGDQFSELIVGFADYVPIRREGKVSVYSGTARGINAVAHTTIFPPTQFDFRTLAVSAGSDVNRDGRSDLIFGAGNESNAGRSQIGAVRVFHGVVGPLPQMPQAMLLGGQGGDYFGSAITN